MAISVCHAIRLEDLSSWVPWLVEYVKDTQADCLDFRTVPDTVLNFEASNLQPIFNALVGSEINSIHFGNRFLHRLIPELSKKLAETKVTKLDISRCFLSADDVLSLMSVLKNTLITKLNISDNALRLENQQVNRFTNLLAKCHLKSLDLSNNGIVPFQKVSILFRKLPDTLTRLDLSAFFLRSGYSSTRKNRQILYNLMAKLQHTAITDLRLGRNYIGNYLAKAIGIVLESSNLEKLDLSCNELTDFGVDLLAPRLVQSKITCLDLSGNKITGNNCLGNFLKDTKIKELRLSVNIFTNGNMFSYLNFLQKSTVETLRLSCCYKRLRVPLLILLRELKFSELTFLDLSGNKLYLGHVIALADVLKNSKIAYIDLSRNEFTDECFVILSDCLNESRLKYVNLSGTASIQPQVFHGISAFLDKTKGSTIDFVDLSDNFIGADMKQLAPVIANSTFLGLNLTGNDLQIHSVSLAEQLKFTAISVLTLSDNNIDDDCVAVLAKCLEETNVVVLSMCQNLISNVGAQSLALSLPNTKLRSLDLERNKIGIDGLESIATSAKSSCMVYINVSMNPGNRTQLLNRVLWDNQKIVRQFASLLKRTAFFTGDSGIFEFDRDFDGVDVDVFIDDCLKLYKLVLQRPCIVGVIEQDKLVCRLKNQKWSTTEQEYFGYTEFHLYVENCELIYKKIVEQPSPIKSNEQNDVTFFNKQALWLVLEQFPRKFVEFVARAIEADLEQHVSLLRKIEDLGLASLVELLLLTRPKYMIDDNQDILHPYVYKLLVKYKQPVCNLDIEPKGVEKIVKYFTENSGLDGASEVVSLLTSGQS